MAVWYVRGMPIGMSADAMAVGAWSHDRTRHRAICPNGATHTSSGHRPGNRIQENQCVLKEHRIGRGGVEARGLRLCGVPSKRGFLFPGDSQGLHPGLICDALLGNVILNTLDEPGIGIAVRAWDSKRGGRFGVGNTVGVRYRKHQRSICPNGACLWIIEPRWEDTARGRWRLGCGSSRPGAVRRGFRQNSIFPVIL